MPKKGILSMVKRDLQRITHSSISEQFSRIDKKVKDLAHEEGRDSRFLRQSIDDAKFYLKTLTGEWNSMSPEEKKIYDEVDTCYTHALKDSLRIRTIVLRSRVSDLEEIADAIVEAQKDGSDSDLLMLYSIKRKSIENGWIPASNLRDAIESTFKRVMQNPSQSYVRLKNVPEALLDPITETIMRDPVKVKMKNGSHHTYDRSSLQAWVDQKVANGETPMNPYDQEATIDMGQLEADADKVQMLNYFNLRSPNFREELKKTQQAHAERRAPVASFAVLKK